MKRQIILASTSPRRRQLFDLLGIKYKVADSKYDEVLQKGLSHSEQVKFLALGKAHAAATKYPHAVIVAADTMVSFGGKILGKPKNKADAERMLKSFSGKAQDVITGVAVLDSQSKQVLTGSDKIKVYFKKLSASDIAAYINSGEPFDKAGAYGPQGPGFNLIKKVEGEFTNILGLPMTLVFNFLQQLGIKI